MKCDLSAEKRRAGWLHTDVFFKRDGFLNIGMLVTAIRWVDNKGVRNGN
jgi:hypothetical protein